MQTNNLKNIKMSTKSGPVFAFSLPGGSSPLCPPVSYTTDHNTFVNDIVLMS